VKKIDKKLQDFLARKNKKLLKKRKRKTRKRRRLRKEPLFINKLKKRRIKIKKSIQKKFTYDNDVSTTIKIESVFGIEDSESIDYFLNTASRIIDFNSKAMYIDIEKCTFMWPSAIALFCSLLQWVESAARSNRIQTPQISSNDSATASVNEYLKHSGFYKYIECEY